MKRFLLSLLCVATLAFTSACASGGSKNEFKVGMECMYAPFNWTQTDAANGAVKIGTGSYAGGYDVEIAKKIAEGLGKELVIVKTEWEGLIPSLTSGKIDAIIAGMSPTEERKQSIGFTDNYYKSHLVVVVKKDGPYAAAKTINDFGGAKVTAQLNTFHYSVIEQMKDVDIQTAMDDFPTMIVALSSGKIDGYVSEKPGAVSAVATNPDLTFIDFDEASGFQCSDDDTAIAVGVKKDSATIEQINKILSEIPESTREDIMNKAVANQPSSN